MKKKRISLTVITDNQEMLTRAMESLARSGAGLVLEDIPVMLFVLDDEDNEDDN